MDYTRDHAAAAVISLAHSAVTYWSCFAIDKHLRHLKNIKLLLSTGYIPVFTALKYLVGGIYQRRDLKLKSVKISVRALTACPCSTNSNKHDITTDIIRTKKERERVQAMHNFTKDRRSHKSVKLTEGITPK